VKRKDGTKLDRKTIIKKRKMKHGDDERNKQKVKRRKI